MDKLPLRNTGPAVMRIAFIIYFYLTVVVLSCAEDPGYLHINCRKFVPDRGDESMSRHDYFNKKVSIARSAIVIIDIWEGYPVLDDLVVYKINPLLDLARKNGILIIHAPSQKPEFHSKLKVSPGDIIVTAYENIDRELKLRGIETLLFAGYDAFKCVMDTPMGIFQTAEREPGYDLIVIRDCVLSSNETWKEAAVNIIEKQFGWSTSLVDLYYSAGDAVSPDEERAVTVDRVYKRDNTISSETVFSPSDTALVAVGTGAVDGYPEGTYRDRAASGSGALSAAVAFARERGIDVVHVPGSYGTAVSIGVVSGEKVIAGFNEFMDHVNGRGYRSLFYCGFTLNEEMLFGSAGIVRLYCAKRYEGRKVPGYYVIEDLVLAFETPETLANETMKESVLGYRDIRTLTFDMLEDIFQ